jgi:hypothetical protein
MMATVIDHLSDAGGAFSPFGDTGSPKYVGQIFRAAGSRLDSVEVLVNPYGGPDATEYRLLVTTVTFSANGFHPGTVLFESPLVVQPVGSDRHATIPTGSLALTPGTVYAFILDAFVATDGVSSSATVFESHIATFGVDYTDGYQVTFNPDGGDRASNFAADWSDATAADLAFRLTFSEPPVTIVGTKHEDLIDATHTPTGQPFASARDDIISGRGQSDALFGLGGSDQLYGGSGNDKLHGGDGNDLLVGGKGKDKLFGEAGADSFKFDASLKQPADKIMDFIAADDTILLSHKIFKSLAEGHLLATAFDAGGKEEHDDRILYKNGKLSYDHDGKGGDDPIPFAKIAGSPALSDLDLIVVA